MNNKNTKKVKNAPAHKKKSVNTRVVLAVIACVLAVGIVSFIASDGVQKTKTAYQGWVVRRAFSKEIKTLREPLDRFGFQNVKNVDSDCQMGEIATYEGKQLLCVAQHKTYTVVNDQNKQSLVASAEKLDNVVQQEGWEMATNATPTFKKWVADVTSGVDYYPDVSATVRKDGYLCTVTAFIAYARPNAPAFTVELICNAPRLKNIDTYLLNSDPSEL